MDFILLSLEFVALVGFLVGFYVLYFLHKTIGNFILSISFLVFCAYNCIVTNSYLFAIIQFILSVSFFKDYVNEE